MEEKDKIGIGTRIILGVDRIVTELEDIIMLAAYSAMTIIVILGIVLRFILKIPNPYGEELSKYLMIVAVYFGSAMCVRKRKHLGISFFVDSLPKRAGNAIRGLADLLVCIVYLWLSVLAIQYAITGIRIPQLSPAMRMPIWIMYGVVALGFCLSTIHAISLFWSDYLTKSHPLNINDKEVLEGGDIS